MITNKSPIPGPSRREGCEILEIFLLFYQLLLPKLLKSPSLGINEKQNIFCFEVTERSSVRDGTLKVTLNNITYKITTAYDYLAFEIFLK